MQITAFLSSFYALKDIYTYSFKALSAMACTNRIRILFNLLLELND